jgi:hypothetical protein
MPHFHQNVVQLSARVLFGLQEPHPHVVCVVIDNEQAIAEAMGDGTFTGPQISEERFDTGREGFVQGVVLRGAAVALWSKHVSQETLFIDLANAGLVGAPWVCWACMLCILS